MCGVSSEGTAISLSQMTVAMVCPGFQECLDINRIVYIVADKCEARMPVNVLNVAHVASQRVVQAYCFVASRDQAITDVRTDKSSAAR
jgi:hypothetical protein